MKLELVQFNICLKLLSCGREVAVLCKMTTAEPCKLEMSTAQRTPRNFLIKFTAPCGHRAIVCLKFACEYLLLCLKFAVQCGHSAVLKKILQRSAVAGRNLAVQCGHSAGKVCPRQLYCKQT